MYSWQFSKNFPLPKNGGHLEFLPKMAKHKIAFISLTMRDRAISSKFSTHRVSKECSLANFQKIFPFPKMAVILNFCQKWKNTKLLLSPKPCEIERFRRNIWPTEYLRNVLLAIFKKFSPPQKWRPFGIFAKNGKTQNCFHLLNHAR